MSGTGRGGRRENLNQSKKDSVYWRFLVRGPIELLVMLHFNDGGMFEKCIVR